MVLFRADWKSGKRFINGSYKKYDDFRNKGIADKK